MLAADGIGGFFVVVDWRYPVERTMFSGIRDFALESRIQGNKRLDTHGLAKVRYQPPGLYRCNRRTCCILTANGEVYT